VVVGQGRGTLVLATFAPRVGIRWRTRCRWAEAQAAVAASCCTGLAALDQMQPMYTAGRRLGSVYSAPERCRQRAQQGRAAVVVHKS